MIYLNKIIDFFKNPKNRNLIIFIGIALFFVLFFKQCNDKKDLKNQLELQKTETTRLLNNEQAKNAVLKNYQLSDSTNRGIIQGFQITQKELQTSYKNLLDGFGDLRNKTTLALAKGNQYIKETIYIQTTLKIDSLGVEHLIGTDTMKIDNDNFRYISFDAPFNTRFFKKNDSTEVDIKSYDIFQQVYPGKSIIKSEQSIGLKVGLFQDKKDKKVYIVAQSKYPGLTFSKLEGADIMSDPISRKTTRQFRKEWGLGFNVGYGINIDTKTSIVKLNPQIGVGLHYTPKWLQFGK